MPSSAYVHTSDMMLVAATLRPRSVLDVGCGWGRWGVLFREVLDIGQRRYPRASWKTTIDAVEIWAPYIGPIHWHVYNQIWHEDILTWLTWAREKNMRYDLVVAGDVLEHLEEPLGVLGGLREIANCAVLASVPLGPNWKQGAVNGNPAETHRFVFTLDMVKNVASTWKVFTAFGKPYAVFITPTKTDVDLSAHGWERA